MNLQHSLHKAIGACIVLVVSCGEPEPDVPAPERATPPVEDATIQEFGGVTVSSETLLGLHLMFPEDGRAVESIAVRRLEAACGAGDAVACRFPEWGQGGKSALAPILVSTCEKGHWGACAFLAQTSGWAETNKDRAEERLDALCEEGVPEACAAVWGGAEDSTALPSDVGDRLCTLCDENVSGACLPCMERSTSSEALQTAEFVLRLARLEQECQRGNRGACRYLWGASAQSIGGRSGQSAARWIELSCLLGDLPSCREWSFRLMTGNGLKRNVRKAALLTEQNCGWGMLLSCMDLGLLAMKGKGVPLNPARGLALLERACEGGILESCVHLGWALGSETEDLERSIEAFKSACDGGETLGCAYLGWTLTRNLDVADGDQVGGKRHLRRACQEGIGFACNHLGAAIENEALGQPLELDQWWPYLQGCRVSDKDACLNLSRLYRSRAGGDIGAQEVLWEACLRGVGTACIEDLPLQLQ